MQLNTNNSNALINIKYALHHLVLLIEILFNSILILIFKDKIIIQSHLHS